MIASMMSLLVNASRMGDVVVDIVDLSSDFMDKVDSGVLSAKVREGGRPRGRRWRRKLADSSRSHPVASSARLFSA
jgi:hypothetical protein